MSVLVFGSINMDLVARTPRLPQPNETLLGSDFITTPGGKGANQAVALAKLEIPTYMVGRVGTDRFGQTLIQDLQAAGVNTQEVAIAPTHSGVAIITVADTGENQIIGIFGANGQVDASDVDRLHPYFAEADAILFQLEISLDAVRSAARAAHAAGVRVILDPAPVQTPNLSDLYPFVDILVPNEVEASQLVGFPVTDPDSAHQAAIALQHQGAHTVIVKLGAQGAFCLTQAQEAFFVPAFVVEAVDTVAAGDAFAGGLTAALVEGQTLRDAIVWGNAAGALACTQRGAQTAMSDRPTFEAFLRDHTAGGV